MYSANTIFLTVFALVFMLRISPYLTLVALAPMPVASILIQYFGSRIHTRFERIQASFSDISAQAQENYSGARLVRAFAREESEIGLFERLNREYIARALRLVQLMGMLWPTLEFVLGISMIITLLAGGHLVIAHKIDVGQFVAFSTYMIMLIWPIIAVGWVINIFQRGTASVMRVDELLKAEPAINNSLADAAIPADAVLHGEIEFRDLNFSYGDTTVLHDISLRIPAGSSLAIVGPTGCGKSTLVHLISRLYEAPQGSLLIDGRPVREYPLAVLRRNIGMVSQETFLFSETIRENLAFGAPDASPEELLEAAEAAHIRQEFEEFPQGFQTMVGERGVTLSGGQKQRSAIARALVRRPAILILDDALASVDTYTEERILGGLRNYTATSTTILISHRVSTVRNADQIAVLDHGRIVELGRHDELLALRRLLRQPLPKAAAGRRTHRCRMMTARVRDQRSENREQRTENREQRTEIRDQGSENRDQGSETRGAGFVSGFERGLFFIGFVVSAMFLKGAGGAFVKVFADAEFGGELIAVGGVGDGLNRFEGEDVLLALDILRG